MNTVLCCAVLLAVIAVTFGEECTNVSQCNHVTCPENDYVLECHNRQCTCTHTTSMCRTPSDCSGNDCRNTWHCVDGRCRCGFGFGGGR